MPNQKRRIALVLVGVMAISLFVSSVIAASPAASAEIRRRGKWPHRRHYQYPKRMHIDRLIAIGAIHLIARAIWEISRCPQEVVHVSPSPTRTPSPQPTYTPSVSATVLTLRNATNWYIVVNMDKREVDLYPGYEQSVSWSYTGREQCVQAWAYRDRWHQELVGTYEGNLIGYQIPWTLDFDYGSFAPSAN